MLAHVLTRRASDVMRSPVPTVGPDDRLARAAEFMATFSVRELPVVEGQVLVGIVTRTDLEPYVGQLEWTMVRIAMTSQPKTVTPDVSVRAVAQALLDGGFNGIPVVVDRTLAGMINRHDLLRMLAECPVDAG
jgi:CBS domain-containing protein